ncbi:M23 family metallopeptidase [Sphingomonas sp. NFR15]|uniref:M23 family metallopeptidase n=1 Tax=Sphingomonas sp. NFR15 TaxID=1566282 RepID=UPI00088E5E0D|nr:M23 family metallopeptidase [Sphingomonas sp. NFR15]SDA20377.1 Murein DD-endopeptidase MepM and murein hydrolase activator NlpD, contain LysM domain [Sphingomonas sp. NFR15]
MGWFPGRSRNAASLAVLLPALAACIPQGAAPDPDATRYRPRQTPPDRPVDTPPAYGQDDAPPRADASVAALPAPPPAWQARPVRADAKAIDPTIYVVRSGDTLRAVADRTGAGSEAIARANGLSAPFMIRAGQRLAIPGGRYHLVRSGETGIAIARAYGIDWSRIVTANGLSEPYTLRAGMRVLIPDATPGLSSAAERAAAFRLDVDDLVTGSAPALAGNQRPAPPTRSPRRVLAPTEAISEPTRLRGVFGWPAQGRIVARFGPSGASGERFNGIKIALPIGTPILAAADGVVAYAGSEVPTLGGLVIIKHGDGWTTVYGHASRLLVQRGQAVKRGQTIALSGDTGLADRPELHFEMRKGRTPIDPIGQLPRS